jgi:chorismate dehydratase
MSRIRVGITQYLNAKPLFYPLTAGDMEHNFMLVEDSPARLADALARKELDIALIPAIEYATLGNGYQIIPNMAISTLGAVKSVLLYSKQKPPNIQRVALDESSRTSAALVKILLSHCFGIHPQYRSLPPDLLQMMSEADAALLIGNQALLAPANGYYSLDLGALWHKHTGMGFVFAVFVIRPGVDAQHAVNTLLAAKSQGVAQIPHIARVEAANLGLSADFCRDYLQNCIHFDFCEEQQQALRRFFQLACAEGLIPEEVPLKFYR